jgi:hypothetical protein
VIDLYADSAIHLLLAPRVGGVRHTE